ALVLGSRPVTMEDGGVGFIWEGYPVSKGEHARQRIVARAAPVFNVSGFAGTSMGQLTQAIGLEKGGIYNHFPSKEALALAAFDYAVDLMAQRFAAALVGQQRAADRLRAIVGEFQHY